MGLLGEGDMGSKDLTRVQTPNLTERWGAAGLPSCMTQCPDDTPFRTGSSGHPAAPCAGVHLSPGPGGSRMRSPKGR